MELFLDQPELTFEPAEQTKHATAQVEEDPQTWPRQVLTELYKQVPEATEYSPQVMFSKIDEEQGFALGVVIITNSTNTAMTAVRPNSSGEAKKVLVPVVIKNHIMSPLDILMTPQGKMFPLNGHRLRQTLFRPETFDMITSDWGDTSLYSMFYPPGRGANDFGSGITPGSGGATTILGPGMKTSSDPEFEMIEAVGPTLLDTDIRRLGRIVETTPGLTKAASLRPVFLAALTKVASFEDQVVGDVSPYYEAALNAAPVHVVQMGFSASHDGYWTKVASRDAFYHRSPTLLSRGEFLKFAGPDTLNKVDTDGVVTVSMTSDVSKDPIDESVWGIVDKPGIYKVKAMGGKELTGWVLPNLVSMDGTRLPLAVFTNGSQAQVQDVIMGAHVAEGIDLPSEPPHGTGVFYCAGPNGVIATAPLAVLGSESDKGDMSYLVRTTIGEDSRVRLVPGLKTLQALGGEFLMPDTAKFLPLKEEGTVALASSPDELNKTASEILDRVITLYGGDGDEFGVRFYNLPKLASQFPGRQDRETAVFALCLAGCSAKVAHQKLQDASTGHTVKVGGLRDVVLAADVVNETKKVASVRSQEITSLRRYAVKEAAVLPNVMTVDAVLSLGFINSENVRMFISRIPYLERSLSFVCEMLLASRLGLNEIPEFACARAVRALDDVTQGLRALALREVDEGGQRG